MSRKSKVFTGLPEKKLALAFILTAFAALFLGSNLGPFQAFNYAGLNIYHLKFMPFVNSYYQGLTLHGVLNALVFTTFFISGLLWYLPAKEMNIRPNMTFSWISYFVMLLGLVMAAVAILANTSNVMYTFYAPLKGHWGFYLGLALVVVASLMVAFEVVRMRQVWKKENPGKVTPIVTFMSVMLWLMWAIASVGIVVEVVVFLIPWSFGLLDGVDPQITKSLFWWTGHPIVYFWLLPAYVSWYGLMPKQVKGELASDSLTRLVFVLFLLFSTPVGFHHQFTDPGIPAGWKMLHSMMTMFVGVPSLITAFTIGASLELGGRALGGKGVLGWIKKLPWNDPSVAGQLMAMLLFIPAGAGGIVLGSFNLNIMLHNTAWIPGHFHITVGGAVTLTFIAMTFWLLPHLTNRKLFSKRLALGTVWSWFIGMIFFSTGMHWEGLLLIPRRAHISNMAENLQGVYAGAEFPMMLTGIGGGILWLSIALFFTVILGTIFLGKKDVDVPEVPFVDNKWASDTGLAAAMDKIWAWFAVAALLVAVVYAPTLYELFSTYVSIPGQTPW